MRVVTSSRANRTILLRLEDSDQLPEALAIGLEIEGITAGWIRASGIIADVELRAGDDVRRVNGPVMAVSIDSSIVGGRDSLVLRGVFARDSGASIETFAGEIVRARAIMLDVVISVLDDAGIAPPQPERKAPTPPQPPVQWSGAIDASARSPEPSPKPQPAAAGRAEPMPVPPKLRRKETEDHPFPEAGDVVEHFAFGRCEVVKSDGDRLHVKLARDGRIREIALEMLKVVALEPADGHQVYRLDRRL